MSMHEKQQMKKDAKQKNEISDMKSNISFRCRGSVTRTRDRLVPNQERYQLRYTPNIILLKLSRALISKLLPESVCKGTTFSITCKNIPVFFNKKVTKTLIKRYTMP